MSYEYDNYLMEHRGNVAKAFYFIRDNIPQVLKDNDIYEWQICFNHDHSKDDDEEYKAYDNYFYGNKSFANKQAFDYAWLGHIHKNPHHWQHWVLLKDGGDTVLLEIPKLYIIEMICDWWSFSWKTGKLFEIFDYYEDHKDVMKLNASTRQYLEYVLKEIRTKLEELDE